MDSIQEVPLLTQVHTELSSISSKIKHSLTEAKVEPYSDPDTPPGFPRQAVAYAYSNRR